jgi:alkanesulfonate monooxygenase SsuD/methylene tetrahydromethanopterin reductase-like flavin-dependent oxidoreductase (luciferase family)
VYGDLMSQIVWAEDAGFESVWLSEHHFTDDGYAPAVFPVLAAIGARTERIRLGTAVCLAPLHHPLRLAEDAAAVDVMSNGRLELGLAPGYRVTEFNALGIPKRQRGRRTDETLEILRAAWTGQEFDYHGEIFSLEAITVQPTPVSAESLIPIHIGGSSQASALRAGRYGCHFMPDVGTSKDLHDLYRRELVKHGFDSQPFEITVAGCVYLCDDEREGWNDVEAPLRYMNDRYTQWEADAGDDQTALSGAEDDAQDLCIVGSPTKVINALRQIESDLAPDRFIFWGRLPGMPIEKANRSLELFVDEVLPAFS